MSAMEFVYVGDPMCSWCWGFAPTIEAMARRYTIPIRVVVGGLRPGPNAQELTEHYRGVLAHHWEQVAGASGQPFDHRFLERDGWVYDTELPAIAVVAMRSRSPEHTLEFFTRLQRAFYAESVDVTDPSVYADLIEGFPVDAESFAVDLADENMKKLAWRDFSEARSLGVSGFPALLFHDGDTWAVATKGYMPYETLEPAITGWLTERYPNDVLDLLA